MKIDLIIITVIVLIIWAAVSIFMLLIYKRTKRIEAELEQIKKIREE